MPLSLGLLSSNRRPRIAFTAADRDGQNKTTFTWTGVSFGEADSSRFLIIQAMLGGGTITSVTVGGQTPTLLFDRGDGGDTDMKIYVLALPTGTSGSVVITGNSSPLGAAFALHAVYNCNITPKQSGNKAGAVTAFPTLTLDPGDVVYYTDTGGSTVVSWTGATQTVADYVNSPSNQYGCATLQASAAGTYPVSSNVTNTAWPKYIVWGR